MKHRAESDKTTLDAVTKEMAKPRMSKSARRAELSLDASRLAQQASINVSGTIEKFIALRPNQPERAQIIMRLPDRRYRKLRSKNTLTNEHGGDVSLQKGAHIKVTVTAKKHRK